MLTPSAPPSIPPSPEASVGATPPSALPSAASPPEPLRAINASTQTRTMTSQSGPVRTVYHHFPSALQSAEPKRDQPASPPLRSVFHNPAMIARELHGPRKNRAAIAAEAAARAATEAAARAATETSAGATAPAEGAPAPPPTPSHPVRSDQPIVPLQVQPILAALGISPNELRGSHGQPYGMRPMSGAMSLLRPSLPPPPPAAPKPSLDLSALSDAAHRVLNAMEIEQQYTRADIMTRAEINVAEWNKVTKQLLDLNLIEREGERRASTYRRLPTPDAEDDTKRHIWRAPTFWRPPGLIRRALLQQQRQLDDDAQPRARRERQAELDTATLCVQLGLPSDTRLIPMLAQPELPDLFWRAVVALANTQGGFIVLGVKARWSGSLIVRGLNDAEATRAHIITQLRYNPKQLSRYSLPTSRLRIVNYAQRDLILIEVSSATADQLPAFLGTNAYTPHPERGTFSFDDSGQLRKCSDAEVSALWARWVHPLTLDFPTITGEDERSEYKHTIQRLRHLGVLSPSGEPLPLDDADPLHNADDVGDLQQVSLDDPDLLAIASPARERAKLPSETMRAIILDLCRRRALTEQDLTSLISRSSATLQRYLLPLLDDGLIAFDLSSQGYRAKSSSDAFS